MINKTSPKAKTILVKDTPKNLRLHAKLARGLYKGPKKK